MLFNVHVPCISCVHYMYLGTLYVVRRVTFPANRQSASQGSCREVFEFFIAVCGGESP